MWSESEDNDNQVLQFVYLWNQKHISNSATIRVSCLGHYQLEINEYYYQGPVFAESSSVYYDEINIAPYIGVGENKIKVYCQYLNVKTHEHPTYQTPGVFLGGSIKDGLFKYTLSDYRLWKIDPSPKINLINRLSADTGFSENTDYTQQAELERVRQKDIITSINIRPIEILSEEKIIPQKIDNGTYDLGQYRVGYLSAETNFKEACHIKVGYYSGYKNGITEDDHNNQDDEFTIPDGSFQFRQFSRRAGRYIVIDSGDCNGEINIKFISPYYNLKKFTEEKITDGIDKEIFKIASNSIQNGLQDQIEDSVVRERALYIGDAYSTYGCLPESQAKDKYYKYILNTIANSQKEDESIPAMSHSQSNFVIPDYTLIYPIFLYEYLEETDDISFAESQLPYIKEVFSWIKSNQDSSGYILDKNNSNYWIFIDWSKRDTGYKYDTALQIYLIKSLESISQIYSKLNLDNHEIITEKEFLKSKLINFSYDYENHGFADSFNGQGEKSDLGLLTNSLAGKYQLFPNEIESNLAFDKFWKGNNASPYSQSWLVEWAINTNNRQEALEIIRRYWGGMVNLGATSVYETYIPNQKRVESSHSHIWGCSPVFLLNQLYQ